MYNLVYGFVAILKELDIISDEAFHALSRELSTKIWPSNSKDSLDMVQQAIVKVEKDLQGKAVKVEPWLDHIAALESRITKLEKSLTKKK